MMVVCVPESVINAESASATSAAKIIVLMVINIKLVNKSMTSNNYTGF